VKHLGAWTLNFIRLFFAVFFLSVALWIFNGTPFVANVGYNPWLWLGLSAIVGLSIGDLCYFKALHLLGPRLGLLIMSLAPPIAAIEGFLFLNEKMSIIAICGMLLTVFGIGWVVTERKESGTPSRFKVSTKGVLFGLAGTTCQATGLVLSKLGLRYVDALPGTFIRMTTAVLVFALIVLLSGRWKTVINNLKNIKGLKFAFGGAFFGPFIGVTLSLVAAKYTQVGVAMTLLSTMPVTVLPYSILIYKEKLSPRAVLGAVLAVVGVALLCPDIVEKLIPH